MKTMNLGDSYWDPFYQNCNPSGIAILKLKDKEGNDHVLEIFRKTKTSFPQKIHRKIYYSKILTHNPSLSPSETQTVYVKTKNLAKCLLLTTRQVKRASKENRLAALIQQRQKVQELYWKSLSKYKKNHIKIMVALEENHSTGLKEKILKKMLWTALNADPKDATASALLDHDYLVIREPEGKVHLVLKNSLKEIGNGYGGIVYEAFSLTSAKMKVIKAARLIPETPLHDSRSLELYQQRTQKNILKEYGILKTLHEKLPIDIDSIQDCPHALTEIDMGGVQAPAFLTKKYKGGDAYSAVLKNSGGILDKMTPEEKKKTLIVGACKIMEGVTYLKKSGINHGDLKPDNLLLEVLPDRVLLKISDFGGTNFLNSPEKMSAFLHKERGETLETFSHEYFPTLDQKLIYEALSSGSKETLDFLQHQRDLFALGASFYALMTQHFAYGVNPYTNRPVLDTPFDDTLLKKRGYGPQVIEIVKKMLNENPYNRSTHEELLKEWETIVTAEYPTEHLFKAFFNKKNPKAARHMMREIATDPLIEDKACYYIYPSSLHPGFYTFCSLVQDLDSGKHFVREQFIKIESKRVLFYEDPPIKVRRMRSMEEISQDYGLPLSEMAPLLQRTKKDDF